MRNGIGGKPRGRITQAPALQWHRLRRPVAPESEQRLWETAVAGLYFEEFQVGQVFQHALRRTLTEADNLIFSALTHNPAALHLDEEYCRGHSEFGTRVINSTFTLGLMVGISVGDTTLGTTVANLGWDDVRFPRPLFPGDTVRVETEVLEMRESRSRPNNGIVIFEHRAFNQNDELVAHCRRSALMLKKPETT